MEHETTYKKRIREIYQLALSSKDPESEARRLLEIIERESDKPLPDVVISDQDKRSKGNFNAPS